MHDHAYDQGRSFQSPTTNSPPANSSGFGTSTSLPRESLLDVGAILSEFPGQLKRAILPNLPASLDGDLPSLLAFVLN
jgi:hypothetical protein